jgi:hypothetical protein
MRDVNLVDYLDDAIIVLDQRVRVLAKQRGLCISLGSTFSGDCRMKSG